ncbi:MAG: hypothetical protein ACJ73D_09445 [Pyrinomonadaceae bacterium]
MPKQTKLEGYLDAYCSALPGGFRVCKVQINENGDAVILVEKGGHTLDSIPASYWGTVTGVDPDGFMAYRGDLDGNGTNELVVVTNEGVENGMGVTHVTAHIFKDPDKFPNTAPVEIPIEEFGPNDNFRFNAKANRTDILVSFWDGSDSLDPKRGWGEYLIGKWFRYKDGSLLPEFERPTLARRFLYRFARQRDNGWYAHRTPYKWLQDPSTHRYLREPKENARLISIADGRLESYALDGENDRVSLRINLQSGETIKCVVNYGFSDKNSTTIPIMSLGLWRQRYAFPNKFDPTYSLGMLVGKAVKLENYSDQNDEKFSNLWFVN